MGNSAKMEGRWDRLLVLERGNKLMLTQGLSNEWLQINTPSP